MKILGISGSPRAKGNTDIAVGGGRDGGQLFTINHIHQWMLFQNMIVVCNNYGLGGSAKAGMKGGRT
jgi:multimeric flavodoxin WrbA